MLLAAGIFATQLQLFVLLIPAVDLVLRMSRWAPLLLPPRVGQSSPAFPAFDVASPKSGVPCCTSFYSEVHL